MSGRKMRDFVACCRGWTAECLFLRQFEYELERSGDARLVISHAAPAEAEREAARYVRMMLSASKLPALRCASRGDRRKIPWKADGGKGAPAICWRSGRNEYCLQGPLTIVTISRPYLWCAVSGCVAVRENIPSHRLRTMMKPADRGASMRTKCVQIVFVLFFIAAMSGTTARAQAAASSSAQTSAASSAQTAPQAPARKAPRSMAETDLSFSFYRAFTSSTSGNDTLQTPFDSNGGMVELRHIQSPLIGYEVT